MLQLCGGNKFNIVKIPVDGIPDPHNKKKHWSLNHFKEVLTLHGFQCNEVKDGFHYFQKEIEDESTNAGRTFGKGDQRTQRAGKGAQRPAGNHGKGNKARTVQQGGQVRQTSDSPVQ